MNNLYRELQRSLESNTPVVVATVAATRGSTPRSPGARMLIRADGTTTGTIGGGCGEGEVIHAALEVHAFGQPRLVHVDLTNPIDGDDKICGGIMDIFLERLTP